MPLPIKHRVIETDNQVVIEQEDTIHVHSDTETVMWSRSWFMKRYCDYCDREILYEETVYELRIENQNKGILEHETLCSNCLSEQY